MISNVVPPGSAPIPRRNRRLPILIVVLLFIVLIVPVICTMTLFFHPGLFFNGSPDMALSTFCSGIGSGGYQLSYDRYSPTLQSKVSSAEFYQMWSYAAAGTCIHDAVQASGFQATTSLSVGAPFSSASHSYRVTLVLNSLDGWKIENLQQVS